MKCRLYYLLVISLLLFVSCLAACKKQNKEILTDNDVQNSKYENDTLLIDNFIDSTRIGIKGFHKLELHKYLDSNDCFVDIAFSQKEDNCWVQIQSFQFSTSNVINMDVIILDYNNDGFCDFTCQSAMAARSANEIRKLFIYSPSKKELVYIRNSEGYANLKYNDELDCLDAFNVYGGSTSSFLKIEADTLRQFARVDLWESERTVTMIDKSLRETVIHYDTLSTQDVYTRYKNYKTLKEYPPED